MLLTLVHCYRILPSFCGRWAPGARISWAVAAVEGPCRSNVPFPFDQDLTLRRSTVGTPTHRFPKRPSSLRERPFHLLPHFRRILLLQKPTSRKTCKVYNLLLTLTPEGPCPRQRARVSFSAPKQRSNPCGCFFLYSFHAPFFFFMVIFV